MRKLILIILVLSFANVGFAQPKEISWISLTDATFIPQNQEYGSNSYRPFFGPTLKELDGQEVQIKGFVLSLDPNNDYYVLSRNPMASCFFCGSGGPESVLELQLKRTKKTLSMDDVATVKGIFTLNADDPNHCFYILKKAVIVDVE